jgi:hypothetical protein
MREGSEIDGRLLEDLEEGVWYALADDQDSRLFPEWFLRERYDQAEVLERLYGAGRVMRRELHEAGRPVRRAWR